MQRTIHPVRRPNVHELRQAAAVVPQLVAFTRNVKESSVLPEQLRDIEFDRIPGGIRKVHWLDLAAAGEGPPKATKRERCHNVRAFEQFWVVTDLPKLHHQVHKRASRIGIAKVRCLGKQIGDGDVGSKDFV